MDQSTATSRRFTLSPGKKIQCLVMSSLTLLSLLVSPQAGAVVSSGAETESVEPTARYIVRFKGEGSATPLFDAPPKNAVTQEAPGKSNAAKTNLNARATESFMRSARSMLSERGSLVHVELPHINAIAAELTPAQRDNLLNQPGVEGVELDPPRYMLAQSVPYGIPLVQSDQVPYGAAPGIKVCVVDSGFDLGHPDLPTSLRVTGQAAPNVGSWFEDGTGHGTHVAGTIMALDNSEGVIGATNGGDYAVHIYKVFPDESQPVSSSNVIAGVQACADAGAQIVNLSLGCTGSGCFSATEQAAFARFAEAGLLVVAAAGNDGRSATEGTQPSYPAAYDSVIAVAALDAASQHAEFSQRYAEVELAAPGVSVLSTVPRNTSLESAVRVEEQELASNVLEFSGVGSASGPLVDCGIGDAVCTNVSGAVCFIERGTVFFSEKAQNCQSGGGVAAIIYNNVPGPFFGTLGEDSAITIPVAGISDTAGAGLVPLLGSTATVDVRSNNYGVRSGTSMATPHVAGVAALVWSRDPLQTNTQIREALRAGALDLGAAGRDPLYGFGLVQAAASVSQLTGDADNDGVANTNDNCPIDANADQTDLDSDGEGDVCDSDRDGDGMSDAYEETHGLSVLQADGLADEDDDGFSNLSEFYAGTAASSAGSVPDLNAGTGLVAAVLPTSRSAQVGDPVTAFVSLINTSSVIATGCSIAPLTPLAADFAVFSTDAQTNAVVGVANRLINISPGASASFVIQFEASASFAPTEVRLRFGCENLGTAATVAGLNTLLLSASDSPVPDVIALSATSSADGVVRTAAGGAGAFGVASVNLGAASQLSVTAAGTNANVPVAVSVCDTNVQGACMQPAAETISVSVGAGATPTFSVFVQAGQITNFDPATTRVSVTFTDENGSVRGATSVALLREE